MAAWRGFALTAAAVRRLDTLLALHPAAGPGADPARASNEVAAIAVLLSQPRREALVLRDAPLQLVAGRLTVLVGPLGSGKSTPARLLLGIWPSTQGKVTLESRNIAKWDAEQLESFLGYVPQELEILDGTFAQNVARFGAVLSEQVVLAARTAGLHEMVLRFPQGYDTPLGPGGRVPSAGQKQRLALARAIYGAPKFVVLDEPDAFLDDVGEQALHTALLHLRSQGTTVLAITHRQLLLARADRVVELAAGRVVRVMNRPAGVTGPGPEVSFPASPTTIPAPT